MLSYTQNQQTTPSNGTPLCTNTLPFTIHLLRICSEVESDKLLEGEEVPDFPDEELAEIEANLDEDDEPSKPKKGKYSAAAAKRTRPKVQAVLYIQSGERDRAPIEKGCFDTYKKVANQEIAKMVWTGQWDPPRESYSLGTFGPKALVSLDVRTKLRWSPINLAKNIK